MGLFDKDDRKMTNYEKLESRGPSQTLQNRDVYEEQQLTRSRLGRKQSPTSRIIFGVVLTILVAFVVWMFISFLDFVNSGGFLGGSFADPDQTMAKFDAGFTFGKFFITLVISLLFYGFMYVLLMRNKAVQDARNDTSDINQYENDQHIALPEELQKKFDWFPDVGATSDVQFSSMISHMMISNKGLNPVMVAKRATSDIVDEDGEIVLYKGEVLRDEDGNVEFEQKPMIDTEFAEALYTASGLPKNTKDFKCRVYYDTRHIPYNPGNRDRDKLQDKKNPINTVSDLINRDWQLPYYEPQRPGGAYLVDTAPVNTMVLAITRAGKGQTVIEPTLDMWTRERRPNNMVINDPKGELLVKFYVRGTVRGFQIVQFNLINAMKTDIYNRAPRFVMKSCNMVG